VRVTTTRRAAVRLPSRRLARGCAAVAAAAVVLPLTGCSGEGEPGGTPPPPGEIEDLGPPPVPDQWRAGWCQARQAATREQALDLMGEPTREYPADGQTAVVWRLREEVLLSLVVDEDGKVVEFRQSVADTLPEDVRAELDCADEPAAS
jgi:hypothetical protein